MQLSWFIIVYMPYFGCPSIKCLGRNWELHRIFIEAVCFYIYLYMCCNLSSIILSILFDIYSNNFILLYQLHCFNKEYKKNQASGLITLDPFNFFNSNNSAIYFFLLTATPFPALSYLLILLLLSS